MTNQNYPRLKTYLENKFSDKVVSILFKEYPKYCEMLEEELYPHETLEQVFEDILFYRLDQLEWNLSEGGKQ